MTKRILKGFCLLAIIAVVVFYGKYYIVKAAKDRAAVKNVNEQHAAADIEGDDLFRSRISNLKQLGVLGEKVAESKADTCYIDSAARGFFGTSTWEQFCQLDYLAGYTAPFSQEETFDRIEAAPRHTDDPTFPRRLHPANRRGCRYSVWPENNITYLPGGSIPKGDGCHIPYPVNGITPRGTRLPGSTSFDYTFNSDEIDRSVDLLWITYTHTYYREDLGCNPDPFCSNSPRSAPIQAD